MVWEGKQPSGFHRMKRDNSAQKKLLVVQSETNCIFEISSKLATIFAKDFDINKLFWQHTCRILKEERQKISARNPTKKFIHIEILDEYCRTTLNVCKYSTKGLSQSLRLKPSKYRKPAKKITKN